MKGTRPAVWASAAVFVVACGAWLFFVPYRPGRILAPIPAGSEWVSLHRDPAARLDQVLANPVVTNLLHGMGVGVADLGSLPPLAGRLANREIAVAYIPHMPMDGQPGWAAVSWVGAWSHWLRWALTIRTPPGMEQKEWGRARWYWTRPVTVGGRRLHMSFTMEEGMVIGCLGGQPESLGSLLACFDGTTPSWGSLGVSYTTFLLTDAAPDRAVRRSAFLPVQQIALDELSGRAVRARLVADAGGGVDGAEAVAQGTVAIDWFGDLPAGVAVASADGAQMLARMGWGDAWSETVRLLTQATGASTVTMALFGGEFSGRLHGVRVPALAAAWPVRDGPTAIRVAEAALTRVGAATGMALLSEPVDSMPEAVFSVSVPPPSEYGMLDSGERAAYAVVDGWMVASSHLDSLTRILRRRRWNPADQAAGSAGALWGGLQPDASVTVACDLFAAGDTIRNGLAVYRLSKMMEGSAGSDGALEAVNRVRDAVTGLQQMGMGRAWFLQQDGHGMWTMEIGTDEKQ